MDFSQIENPYSPYNETINPKHFMWEWYKYPICSISDERAFLTKSIDFLKTEGKLIESFIKIEEPKESEEQDEFSKLMYPDSDGRSYYLYKDNLIGTSIRDDETINLVFYYALGSAPANKDFEKWVVRKKGESKVSVLIQRNGGMVAQKVSFPPPKIDDLELNYGTGFKKVHDRIVKKLNDRDGKLFIFHGPPGTGKTVYTKYLSSIIDREFIFIPVSMIPFLGDAQFLSLLMNHKEAVLVIEDAEGAIRARGTEGSNESAVSIILNLTDGLLCNVFRLSIIASYNCDKQLIDKALLRKGRLASDHSFLELSTEDAKRLAKYLEKNIEITKPTSLSDIYNNEEDTGYVPEIKKSMGFGATLNN